MSSTSLRLPSVTALARSLVRNPLLPSSLVEIIKPNSVVREFVRVVRLVFPARADEILCAGGATPTDREGTRCSQFVALMEAEWFPVQDCEEYENFVYGIPIPRNAWETDDYDAVQDRASEHVLLIALCESPFAGPYATGLRAPVLDEASRLVGEALAKRIPADGFSIKRIHAALDGTAYAALGAFADWLWGQTGSCFLDVSYDMEIDAPWDMESLVELKSQWQLTERLLRQIDALTTQLQAAPKAVFYRLLRLLERTPEPPVAEPNKLLFLKAQESNQGETL